MAKKQVNIRLNDLTIETITYYRKIYNMSEAEFITYVVDFFKHAYQMDQQATKLVREYSEKK